ncbi:hypothetical protein ACFL5F_06105 [Planctomycetota bacterium]
MSNWLANGMSEYEVMILAGHADFKTIHEFYLAVKDDLVDRATQVASRAVGQNLARALFCYRKGLTYDNGNG